MNIAELDKVSYIYPAAIRPALLNISLSISQGEFLGVIGPTGAGKTTFCLTLNGIVPQFYGGRFFGYVNIAGLDTLSHPVSLLSRYVGSVFEDPETQLISTSVENEIAFTLENLRIPREEILERIPRVLAAVRLEGMQKKHPQELSGGQKQRLAIAAALAVKPSLLILDEPTSQLDPIGSMEVFETVKELNKDLGITIVMVSHAAEEMAQYADRIALLFEGKLEALAPPQEIYSQVEKLAAKALRAPEIAQTFHYIKKHLNQASQIPVTLEAGIQELGNIRGALNPTHSLVNSPLERNQEPLLSVQNLEHTYPDGTQALRDISLEIQTGEYVLIIGQNGAGKSTLVKHFLNLLQPTRGQVCINGQAISQFSVSELARSIGYVAQNPDNQIFNTSVEKEVSFALKNLGYEQKIISTRIEENLELMGLLEQRHAHPLALPKGDRARIVIAAILAMQPEIIIFDEPTTGQDYQGARAILEVSRQLHALGKTVIVITHHLYLMPDYAQRVIVMGQGTILLDAPLRQAYHQTELLKSTFLTPPQAVVLAQELSQMSGQDYPLLTPLEIAQCFR